MSVRDKILAILAPIALAGCDAGSLFGLDARDYWSEIVDDCGYVIPGGTPVFQNDGETGKTSLTPECKKALKKVLEFDDESFESAPEGFKDKVLEAFQVLAAYPLKMPPNGRILGRADNAIPLGAHCVFAPHEHPDLCDPLPWGTPRNMNQAIFNYVANRIKYLRYGPSFGADDDDGKIVAEYTLNGKLQRVLQFFDPFWVPDRDLQHFHSSYIRAMTLVHEARHGDGYMHHFVCENFPDEDSCDPDINGPYGIEGVFALALLHGSAPQTGPAILDDLDLALLAYRSCYALEKRVNRLPPEIREALDDGDICAGSTQNFLDNEGIDRNVEDDYFVFSSSEPKPASCGTDKPK